MAATQFLVFTRIHTHEIVRDRRAAITVVLSFVALPGLFWAVDVVISASTGTSIGLLRTSLPLVAATSFMAVAFILTTVPLVRYRSAGVLRTLSTTPAQARVFLLGHASIRAGILCLEAGAILAIAAIGGATQAGTLAITLFLGAAMILALGYLLAARLASLDVALQLAYLIPMIVLATSGALFPLDILPSGVAITFRLLPTTWLVDAARALIVGTAPTMPILQCWALMVAATVAMGWAALRLNRWR